MNVQQKAGGCPVAHGGQLGSLKDPEIISNPKEFYRAMRTQDPVYYDEKIGMYLVTRYDDIVEVLRDPITYSDKMGYEAIYASGNFEEFKQILERDGGGFFPDAIKDDPPAHTRVRKLMEKAFTAHRVATLEPGITKVIVDLIEHMLKKCEADGVVDAVHEFAIPVTINVICEQLGIAHFNARKIERWSQAVTAQISQMQSREQMLENAKQICELQNFIIAEMKAREAEPREDMISDIVHARLEDGTTLTFEEAVSIVRAIIVGGHETTATALSNLLFLMATRPEVEQGLREAAEDERKLNRFVEELLRLAPPTRALARTVTRDVELGGKRLPKGAHLLVVFESGNDDETEFACPRSFDPERANLGRHVAFGGGVHRCIGAALARGELRASARELARRVGPIRLAIPPEEVEYLQTVATHTIKALPLVLERRA